MNSDHRPVRVTPTHAGPDSKGIVSVFGWDLEGMVAFYLVGGALAGMLLAFSLNGRPVATRLGAGLLPVVGSALWIKRFVHGKAPRYQGDIFERWIRGGNFGLRPQSWCRRQTPQQALARRLADGRERHG